MQGQRHDPDKRGTISTIQEIVVLQETQSGRLPAGSLDTICHITGIVCNWPRADGTVERNHFYKHSSHANFKEIWDTFCLELDVPISDLTFAIPVDRPYLKSGLFSWVEVLVMDQPAALHDFNHEPGSCPIHFIFACRKGLCTFGGQVWKQPRQVLVRRVSYNETATGRAVACQEALINSSGYGCAQPDLYKLFLSKPDAGDKSGCNAGSHSNAGTKLRKQGAGRRETRTKAVPGEGGGMRSKEGAGGREGGGKLSKQGVDGREGQGGGLQATPGLGGGRAEQGR